MLTVLNNTEIPEKFSLSSPSKISLIKDRAFSLPAGPDFTCPGATESCVGCYAQKGRHIFGPVQALFARNFALMRSYEQEGNVAGCAADLLAAIPANAPLFRIHESGDFHSQFAIDVWTKVVAARPQTAFWAYTRSFKLNFHKLIDLPNMTLWASTDPYNCDAAQTFVGKHPGVKFAIGPLEDEAAQPEHSFICPVTSGKLVVDGACEKCQLCVHSDRTTKNVVFLKH